MREGFRYIAGVDEAGRGPMAGPVVAAAVMLPEAPEIVGIDDSKKLAPVKRERLFQVILDECLAFGIGIRSAKFVDEKGIAEATHSAMRDAVGMLAARGIVPDLVLVDGYLIKGLDLRQEAIVKGDAKAASIACASIIAKVVRDRIMREYDILYPKYGLGTHKGYCTGEHRALLHELGPSPIHRRSYQPVSESIAAGSAALDGAGEDLT